MNIFHFSRPVFLILFLLVSTLVVADSEKQDSKAEAYRYLSVLRRASGMIPFKINQALENSAGNHARYLARNRIAGHIQRADLPGYTGKRPGDRALVSGYESRAVTENFSSGPGNPRESIDGLMSAIYHRFGFLDFSKNEVGVSVAREKQRYQFVYNMGNDRLNHYCQYSVFTDDGQFYQNVCKHNEKVSASMYDQMEEKVVKSNPPVVVWPPDGADNVSTVFYEEIPDPLPDYAVSGYPLSIQLNPYYFRRVKILRFKIFKVQNNQEIRPVRLLSRRLDPNKKFTDNQFALFPLKRLDWNTSYRVEAMLKANGKLLKKSWRFKTKKLPAPLYVISAHNDDLWVKPNKLYAVHIPPLRDLPYIEQLQWKSTSALRVDVSWEDKNTILINLNGEKCGEVLFNLNGNRSFRLRIGDTIFCL